GRRTGMRGDHLLHDARSALPFPSNHADPHTPDHRVDRRYGGGAAVASRHACVPRWLGIRRPVRCRRLGYLGLALPTQSSAPARADGLTHPAGTEGVGSRVSLRVHSRVLRLDGVHGTGRVALEFRSRSGLAAGCRRSSSEFLVFLGWLAFPENTFAAPVVKIQEGQKAIDTGVYGIVRHPMYAGAIVYLVSRPLLLGSGRGLTRA